MIRYPHPPAAVTLADIRIAVAHGYADVEAGRVVEAEEAFAELEIYFRTIAADDASALTPVIGGTRS